MMITPENLIRHELIGLQVKITESKNKANIGIEGRVVDETRNTLTIETKSGRKNFMKEQCFFSFLLPGGEKVNVDGRVLVARPEDRIKKKFRKW